LSVNEATVLDALEAYADQEEDPVFRVCCGRLEQEENECGADRVCDGRRTVMVAHRTSV